jgi:hypothetical protein
METWTPGNNGFWRTSELPMAIARQSLWNAPILAWKPMLGTSPAIVINRQFVEKRNLLECLGNIQG